MSDGSTPQRYPDPPESRQYARLVHNASIALVVVCPVLALLPPRKLDIYTFGLVGTAAYSANYLVEEQTGRSTWQHVRGMKQTRPVYVGMEMHQSDVQEQARRERQGLLLQERPEQKVGIVEQVQELRSSDDWKVRREEEVKEALEEGKGLGDMIMDQIWEVWNWGKSKDDDDD